MAIFRRGPPKPVWMGYIKQVALLSQTPRDASWLSVVSFNSTIPEAQFFITSYFSFWFSRAYNLILFCCLRRNVQPCCHTHDSRPPWLCTVRHHAWSILHGTQQCVDRTWSSKKSAAECKIQTSVQQLLIARIDNHWFQDFSLPHLHSTPPLGGFPCRLVRRN